MSVVNWLGRLLCALGFHLGARIRPEMGVAGGWSCFRCPFQIKPVQWPQAGRQGS
jgi:hypothetical protein